jgi:hypothetical protein
VLKDRQKRDQFLEFGNQNGVQVRPVWTLMNHLPMYRNCQTTVIDNAQWLEDRVLETDPLRMLEQLAEKIKALFALAPSKKHMSGRDIGRQEPTPSLNRRANIGSIGEMMPAAA